MHEHVNDEIISYVRKGTMYHKDSAGYEVPISSGNLMMMNAGASFWHEEKVKQEQVEMLQIFIRPEATDLEPNIQFAKKHASNRNWNLLVGPSQCNAPVYVRQDVYMYDAHPEAGDRLEIPVQEGYHQYLYVMHGEIAIGTTTVSKFEAVTDTEHPLPPINVQKQTTLVLFLVNVKAKMSMTGTISGKRT